VYLPKKYFLVAEPCSVGWLRITTAVLIDCDTLSGPKSVRSEYRLGALYTGNVLVVTLIIQMNYENANCSRVLFVFSTSDKNACIIYRSSVFCYVQCIVFWCILYLVLR
jgi:hypothetical protein